MGSQRVGHDLGTKQQQLLVYYLALLCYLLRDFKDVLKRVSGIKEIS